MITRIITTEAANNLIDELKKVHGDLMFHQSGGCCDGSAPMCFPKGEFYLGNSDVTMSVAWKTYRKSLRDLPTDQSSKTKYSDITWPSKP